MRWNKGILLLSFEGRVDRNEVENLRNTELLAEVDVNEPMDEDVFHIAQIVDCLAFDQDGNEVGKVVDVLALPAADTLVIAKADGEILVPFVKHHVPTVEIEKKRIVLANIEGLL